MTLDEIAQVAVEDEIPMTQAMRDTVRERLVRAFAAMPDRATLPRIEVAHETTVSVWQPEAPTQRGGR